MSSTLLSPLSLRANVVARNRVFLAPLTNQQSHADGTLSDDELNFLAARADGGFGLVETCAAYVSPEGKAWPGELGVHNDAMRPGLVRLAARIHAAGALAAVQLFHGGMRAKPAVSGLPAWSASAYMESGEALCRAAAEADLARVVEDFAAAARRCADAGFDVLELHGAHGYLLSQFLSATYNRREDAWGGDLPGRARLLRTVARAVRDAAPGCVLAVRLSPEDFGQARGLDLDESLQLARWLVDDGMELLHLSLWDAAANTRKRPEAHAVPLFRDAVGSSVRIVTAGGIWTRAEAEAQRALGADAVALGRVAIAHPDWPAQAMEGDPTRPPFTPEALRSAKLGDAFVGYMRRWKGFVADTQP